VLFWVLEMLATGVSICGYDLMQSGFPSKSQDSQFDKVQPSLDDGNA
jgi:hypothetical protein